MVFVWVESRILRSVVFVSGSWHGDIDQRRRREIEGQIHPSIKEKIEKAYMFVSSLTIGIGGTHGRTTTLKSPR